MDIESASPAMGARITGLTLNEANDDLVGELRTHLLKHHLLIIAGQQLHPEQLQRFGSYWGELRAHPSGMHPKYPFIQTLANKGNLRGEAFSSWHSDMTWHPTPPDITMLFAREVPTIGADTGYANQQLAWQTLNNAAKDRRRMFRKDLVTCDQLTGLKAFHSGKAFGQEVPDSIHPVVRTHNETGQQALFVNPEFTSHIIDVTAEQSQRILWPLWMHSTNLEFTYRHKWSEGDLLIWDNRSVMHTAIFDYDAPRRMMRIIVGGNAPA